MKAITNQYTYNNETFSVGSYNGFSILIRDKDGFINAIQLLNNINEKESITKKLKNIVISPEFIALEKEILDENVAAEIHPLTLHYILDNSCNIKVRGTYIHKGLLMIFCIKRSVKYLRIVGKIMESINDRNFELLNDHIKNLQNTIT
jgi:hypothetical protein